MGPCPPYRKRHQDMEPDIGRKEVMRGDREGQVGVGQVGAVLPQTRGGGGRKAPSPTGFRRSMAHWRLDFRLVASRIVRKYIYFCSKPPSLCATGISHLSKVCIPTCTFKKRLTLVSTCFCSLKATWRQFLLLQKKAESENRTQHLLCSEWL